MTRANKLLGWSGVLAITVMLHMATTSATNFSIKRVALMFDDRKPATIIKREGKLSARAEISFAGNGLLRGAWEIAGPNPDGDKPQYRTLALVQQHLVGREATIVDGPRLPTETTGTYLVRLKITEPSMSSDTPTIRYSVIEKTD